MAGLMRKVIMGVAVAVIAGLFVQGYASRPEIRYHLEPQPQIQLGSDRIGRISIEAINRGGTGAVGIIHLKGDNVAFIENDNKPYLEIKDGEIFHHVSLPRDMESYGSFSDYFYVEENAYEFSINVEVTVRHEISFSEFSLIFSHVSGTYPIVAEYIQTGPDEYSLK